MKTNNKAILSILFLVLFQNAATANTLTCEIERGSILNENVKIEIDSASATIQVGEDSRKIDVDHAVWDGHKSGLITGKGLSFHYESHFGCVRNVRVTADFKAIASKQHNSTGFIQTLHFKKCSGDSMRDEFCSSPN